MPGLSNASVETSATLHAYGKRQSRVFWADHWDGLPQDTLPTTERRRVCPGTRPAGTYLKVATVVGGGHAHTYHWCLLPPVIRASLAPQFKPSDLHSHALLGRVQANTQSIYQYKHTSTPRSRLHKGLHECVFTSQLKCAPHIIRQPTSLKY